MADGLAAIARRAAVHHALGDPHRLAMVEALWISDRSPTELRAVTGLPSNLLSFHLDVLEQAGLVRRHRSQGDRRRRYVALITDPIDVLGTRRVPDWSGPVLFVCTRNAARSQLAAALWTATTGERALSAGTEPAGRVHPLAIEVARSHGLDLSGAAPLSYEQVGTDVGLVVSVCDRARESSMPLAVPLLHWSVPDPVGGRRAAFERAFDAIRGRIARLAGRVAA